MMAEESSTYSNSNSNSNSNSPSSNKKRGNYDLIRSNLKSTLFNLKSVHSPSARGKRADNQLMMSLKPSEEILEGNLEEKKQGIFYIHSNFRSFYREGKKLGEGCVGLVRKVQKISNNEIFAVKIVKIKDEESIFAIKKEFLNLKPLDHPNIVKVHELYIDRGSDLIYLIMEYVKAKEMFKVLKKQGSYSEFMASRIFKQILQAIHYLHSQGICHRDLKPNNILCSKDGNEVKITDFNVSKFDSAFKKKDKFGFGREKIKMWTYTGTIAFSAPEIFQEGEYNESVDMWSAGVVLYTMLCGYQPFQADFVADLINQICRVKYEFNSDPWDQISKSAKDLISRCLTKNPSERITPLDALMHPWIAHKKASTNILPSVILENLHKNIQRLTKAALLEEAQDENKKKRTKTDNFPFIEKRPFPEGSEECKGINEENKETSDEKEIKAMSQMEGLVEIKFFKEKAISFQEFRVDQIINFKEEASKQMA